MGHDFTKTVAGETVGFWRAELNRFKVLWEEKSGFEERRKELREIVSDYEYGPLVAIDTTLAELGLSADQRDYHIIPRFVDRLKGLAGDEKPKVQFSRNMTGLDPRGKEVTLASVGEIQDRAVMRAMDMAGAPEENEDGIGAICTEGATAYWYEMTGLPTLQEALLAGRAPEEVARQAARGVYQPSRLQEHDEMALGLRSLGSDREARRRQIAGTAPGEAPIERQELAAAEHIEMQEKEDRKPNPFWMDDKFRIKCSRYPVGTWFRMDATVFKRRDLRWMARLLAWGPQEAKTFEGFRKSVRDKLRAKDYDPDSGVPMVSPTAVGADPVALQEANGVILIWHILDRKEKREYFLPEEGHGVDEFLDDREYTHLDTSMRPILKSVGSYPGFFPVSLCRGKVGTKDVPAKLCGIPLALPGLKGQKTVIKLLSRYLHMTGQASAVYTVVEQEMFDTYKDTFTANRGGVFPRPGGTTKDSRPAVENFSWMPPPAELWRLVQDEVGRTLEDLAYPQLDFTARPVARTATQEQLSSQAGQLPTFSVIRSLELSYSEQAWIVFQLMLEHYTWVDEEAEGGPRLRPTPELKALVGPIDAEKLTTAWQTIGIPQELPDTTFAPQHREEQLALAKVSQALSLHERAKAEVNPATQAPLLRTDYLLQEASKLLGFGPLEKFELTEEEQDFLKRKAEAEIAQPGEDAGKPRDSQGDPRSLRENRGQRDSARGRERTTQVGNELAIPQRL